ncbi:MAG: radical SAM protein [Nitrospirae bacterium]|nr:radical SAM protein [Nitrospirota bacterium]
MVIRRVSFIEAGSPGLHIFSKFPIPRLGAVLLSTILRERGYEVKAFIEDIAEPDWSFIESSDIVCISTITSTAMKAYGMGERLKALGIPVIMGGAHPTFLPDESLKYADFVIRGEGEYSLVELLEYMEKGTPALTGIKGLSYRDNDGRNVHNPSREFIEDLDSLPEPDFSLVHKWNLSNIYPVLTSRGCPFDCKFCSVIQMFGRSYRFKSVEATLKELKYVASVSKATKFIVDDNFTANKRRTKEILRGMIVERIKMRWSAQVRTDVANDPELLRLMADSGCHTLYIGFESINAGTLEAYNKKQGLEDIISCIRTVKDHGIHIHGMFVLGADTDDVETIRGTADFATDHGIDTVQFLILTPLPGTPLFHDMTESRRLLHTDWSKYDVQHVVFKPWLMSAATLQIETFRAMARFYSWRYILRHLARFDLHYAAIGIFGKTAIHKSLKASSTYLQEANVQ